jgi:hypothetical protein
MQVAFGLAAIWAALQAFGASCDLIGFWWTVAAILIGLRIASDIAKGIA